MKILLVSPLFSQHWDLGHLWIKAFSDLGHHVSVWDFRLCPEPPHTTYDFAFVLKGSIRTPFQLKSPKFVHWPDAVERTPDLQETLSEYDKVFGSDRTAEWIEWLPEGISWDPDLHKPLPGLERTIDTFFFGTNTERKFKFLNIMQPQVMAGNGWSREIQALYLIGLVDMLSRVRIALNVHPNLMGPNGRMFEAMSCAFTITDKVRDVDTVLGEELTRRVGFDTPEEGKAMIEYFLSRPSERDELWEAEREAIKPYTYKAAAKKVLSYV